MMPLSLSLGSLFEAYVKKVMYTYDASGIAVAIVDREQPVRELFFAKQMYFLPGLCHFPCPHRHGRHLQLPS